MKEKLSTGTKRCNHQQKIMFGFFATSVRLMIWHGNYSKVDVLKLAMVFRGEVQ